MIDIPGHPRVRRVFESYLPRARAVVFMVDSVDFSSSKGNAADALYDLLTQPLAVRRRLPILLACNKAGEPGIRERFRCWMPAANRLVGPNFDFFFVFLCSLTRVRFTGFLGFLLFPCQNPRLRVASYSI